MDYYFSATFDISFDDAVENIDIGGPTMLRSASKNFQDVAVLVDPSDYEQIIQEIKGLDGDLSYKTRLQLAKKVFSHTSRYDTIITDYLTKILEDMGDKK